ncbi:hypothetical protein IMY05_C4516000100 [Salix suchowensis]|nr:hypothetical protein IMY05_C4516000100 [Salix suchowensis]
MNTNGEDDVPVYNIHHEATARWLEERQAASSETGCEWVGEYGVGVTKSRERTNETTSAEEEGEGCAVPMRMCVRVGGRERRSSLLRDKTASVHRRWTGIYSPHALTCRDARVPGLDRRPTTYEHVSITIEYTAQGVDDIPNGPNIPTCPFPFLATPWAFHAAFAVRLHDPWLHRPTSIVFLFVFAHRRTAHTHHTALLPRLELRSAGEQQLAVRARSIRGSLGVGDALCDDGSSLVTQTGGAAPSTMGLAVKSNVVEATSTSS